MSAGLSLTTLASMGINLWRGFWVLETELRWMFGNDMTFAGHIAALRRRRAELEASARGSSADQRSEGQSGELALLEEDLAEAVRVRNAAHKAHLAPLRQRFPEFFN